MQLLHMVPETSFSAMQRWQCNSYLFLIVNFGTDFVRSENKVLA